MFKGLVRKGFVLKDSSCKSILVRKMGLSYGILVRIKGKDTSGDLAGRLVPNPEPPGLLFPGQGTYN